MHFVCLRRLRLVQRVRSLSPKALNDLKNEFLKDLRDKYHLSCGETVIVSDSGEGIIIRHGNGTLRGMLKGEVDIKGFEKDIRSLREEWKL